MSHVYHPRTTESPIFFDECPECRHHAENPVAYLDDERIVRMWNEMIRVETSEFGDESYRSRNDAIAGRKMREVAIALQRLSSHGVPITGYTPIPEGEPRAPLSP